MTLIDESSDGSSGELARGELVAGRYRIERVLGRGASGTVYEAEHQWTRRRVALKVLRAEWSMHERVVSRFLREARVCAELSHPSLVAVLDMGQDEHDGLLFLAQELVEGQTLRATLDARKTLSVAETLDIVGDIAGALEVVHGAGLVHRDVKPENIIVCPPGADGQVLAKLIDFGIAREIERDSTQTRTQLGAIIGTPRYMSPEQARATGAIDARSDQYSLAVVAYECLTGRTPHEGESTPMLLANLLTQPPLAITKVHSELPTSVSRAVMRALSIEPRERFESASAFAAAMAAPGRKASRRSVAALGALLIVTAAIGALSALHRAARTEDPRARTTRDATTSITVPTPVNPTVEVHTQPAPALATAPDAAARDDAMTLAARRPPVRNARTLRIDETIDAGQRDEHNEVSTVDAQTQRNWLRPATFGDAGGWLRAVSVR